MIIYDFIILLTILGMIFGGCYYTYSAIMHKIKILNVKETNDIIGLNCDIKAIRGDIKELNNKFNNLKDRANNVDGNISMLYKTVGELKSKDVAKPKAKNKMNDINKPTSYSSKLELKTDKPKCKGLCNGKK